MRNTVMELTPPNSNQATKVGRRQNYALKESLLDINRLTYDQLLSTKNSARNLLYRLNLKDIVSKNAAEVLASETVIDVNRNIEKIMVSKKQNVSRTNIVRYRTLDKKSDHNSRYARGPKNFAGITNIRSINSFNSIDDNARVTSMKMTSLKIAREIYNEALNASDGTQAALAEIARENYERVKQEIKTSNDTLKSEGIIYPDTDEVETRMQLEWIRRYTHKLFVNVENFRVFSYTSDDESSVVNVSYNFGETLVKLSSDNFDREFKDSNSSICKSNVFKKNIISCMESNNFPEDLIKAFAMKIDKHIKMLRFSIRWKAADLITFLNVKQDDECAKDIVMYLNSNMPIANWPHEVYKMLMEMLRTNEFSDTEFKEYVLKIVKKYFTLLDLVR